MKNFVFWLPSSVLLLPGLVAVVTQEGEWDCGQEEAEQGEGEGDGQGGAERVP